jgi:hypothetical protein
VILATIFPGRVIKAGYESTRLPYWYIALTCTFVCYTVSPPVL